MNMRDKLLLVADTYCEAVGRSRSRVSTLAVNDGKRLDLIASGRDLNTGTYESAMLWFSDNWPDGAAWPEDVDRPAPTCVEAGQ